MSQGPHAVQQAPVIERRGDVCAGRFLAMASPCEILIVCSSLKLAAELVQLAADEAWRIEQKFSRYRPDNLMYALNASAGKAFRVDSETELLLNFAAQCYQLSEGLFDITSGVLRRAWNFKSGEVPAQQSIDDILPLVGWDKVRWQAPELCLQQGMELDFGGIGKEYAVDRSAALIAQQCSHSFVVNYGGDLVVSGPRNNGASWHVAVDNPAATDGQAFGMIALQKGGLCTSGDAQRYIMHQGQRYSHILNPKTGWPVRDAPRSVTVVAANCLEAGMLSTLAMLHAQHAKAFLEAQGLPFWIFR